MSRFGLIVLFLAVAVFAQEPPAYYNAQRDSVAVEYARMADYYAASGERLSKVGIGFFIGGGALIVLATADFIYLLKKDAEKKAEDPDSGVGQDNTFSLIILAGVGSIFGGIAFKVGGNKKKHRAKFYKEQLQNYRENGETVNLEIMPTFNPIRQAFGGNLLLDF